jgi:hypothetical protein
MGAGGRMSYEHFYWFFDRKATDKVLRATWSAFLERHPWKEEALRQLLEFAVDPTPGPRAVRSILDTRTLAWTVAHSTPALFVVNEIVEHVPALARKGGFIAFSDCRDFETLAVNAVAARAFLDGRIGARTLRAVFAVHGEYVLDLQFDLQRVETSGLLEVERAIHARSDSKPLFAWLGKRPADAGYYWLREADTTLFVEFVQQAWAGSWPMLPLDPEVVVGLDLKPAKVHTFRHLPIARKLATVAKKLAGRDLALVRYFELEVL